MVAEDPKGTPRSLRISFEFQIPRGLRSNVRDASVQRALDTIADRVIGLAETLVPWAAQVVVRKQWVYNWTDYDETIALPETDKNSLS